MTYKDTHPRQSLALSPEQWAALDALAADLAGPAPKGRTAGSPSWRTLIRDIADGKLAVVPADGVTGLSPWQGWEQATKEEAVMIYRGSDIDAAEAQP